MKGKHFSEEARITTKEKYPEQILKNSTSSSIQNPSDYLSDKLPGRYHVRNTKERL